MRAFLLIVFIAFTTAVTAQQITIKLKTGEVVETTVTATSSSSIFTKNGNYKYTDIDKVNFPDPQENYQTTIDKILKNVGVKNSDITELILDTKIEKSEQKDFINTTRFEKQRMGGKFLQLTGGFLIGYTVYKNQKDSQDLRNGKLTIDKYKPVNPFLPLAGIVAFGLGIIIDIEAGFHLKKK